MGVVYSYVKNPSVLYPRLESAGVAPNDIAELNRIEVYFNDALSSEAKADLDFTMADNDYIFAGETGGVGGASYKLPDSYISSTSITQHQANLDHNTLLNFNIAQHRSINDSGNTTTDLWSASKISAEISAATRNLDIKDSVLTVATSNITLSGEQTLNGVLTSNSRVGVVGQTAGSENGIYVTSSGAWSRAVDADFNSEVTQGLSFFVTTGAKQGFQYILTTPDPIVINTTSLSFTEVKRVEFGTVSGTATEGNDPRVPTQDENDALLGTNGTVSNTNRYVTNSDPRNTNSRSPTAHASSHQHSGSDEIATATPGANAIPKAGSDGKLSSGWGGSANTLATLDGSAKLPLAQISEVAGLSDLSDVSAKTGTGTTVVMQGSPNITTPTIADFTNSTHNHQNNAGGGSLDAAAISTGTLAFGRLPGATEIAQGAAELATQSETDAGTDDGRIITPLKLATTPRLPTQDENDALQGTNGSPSNTNRYVTNSDARNTNSRTPTAHATSHQHGGSDEIATTSPSANAIPKAGSGSELAAGWLPVMVGDSGSGGVKGAVPAPASGDAIDKFLSGAGTWLKPATLTGRVVWVDSVNGNDSTALHGHLDRPFLTITAALAAASSGDAVMVLPGSYSLNTTQITMPSGVSLVGVDARRCVLTYTGSSAVSLITMAANALVSNLTILINATGGPQIGVAFTGTTNSTALLYRVIIDPSSTGTFIGVNITATGTVGIDRQTVKECVIRGSGASSGLVVNGTGGTTAIIDTTMYGLIGCDVVLGTAILNKCRITGTGPYGLRVGSSSSAIAIVDGATTISPSIAAGTTGVINYDGVNFPVNNITATTDPTSTDDILKGYWTGSKWINTSNNTVWICTDAAESAAVWRRQISAGESAGGDLSGSYPNPTINTSSETVPGKIEIATQTETDTGTDDNRAITPLKLATTPRLPTQNENDALQGTNGSPSTTNRYVTDSDPRNTNSRSPTAHANSHQHSGSDEIATATPGANAIPKAGAGSELAAGWLPVMVGDSGSGGTKGAVPAPAAGDAAAGRFLSAAGNWDLPSAGSVTIPTGRVIWVDSVNGNDGTGLTSRLDKPFLTIPAAMAVATSGDTVYLLPGNYSLNTTQITMSSGVSLVGIDAKKCIISYTGSSTITLITMAANSVVSNLTILVNATGGPQTGFSFPGTTNATAQLYRVTIDPTTSGTFLPVSITGTGTVDVDRSTIKECVLKASGSQPGISINGSGGTSAITDSIMYGLIGCDILLGSLLINRCRLNGTGVYGLRIAATASAIAVVDGATIINPSILVGSGGVCSYDGKNFPIDNTTATVDPTSNDDISIGYAVGSRWFNTSNNTAWICISGAASSAIWRRQISASESAGGDLTGTYPNPSVVASSETVAGKIELATQTETDTGTDDNRAITPLKLATTPRLPTQNENDALQGTNGSPSNTNRYVTDSDARNTNARAPTAHASSHQHSGSDEIATATPGANAIPKAGSGSELAAGWLPVMVGDSGSGGTKGAVPAPAAGDAAAGKFLSASGAWSVPAGGGGGSPGGSNTQVQYNNSSSFGGAANLTIQAAGYPTIGDATSPPSAPASGSTLFAKTRAGRRMLGQIGPSGVDYSFQPLIATNKIGIWSATGNGTTVSVINFGTSNTGTATTRSVATTNFSTGLRRVAFVSSTTAGSSAGTRHNIAQFFRGTINNQGGFMYVTRFVIDTVQSGMRWFVGLLSSASVIGNVNPSSLTNIIGFGIDAGQTTVNFFNNDGSGSATATDLGASFPATTATVVYEARIFSPPNGSDIFYSLDRLDSAATAENSVNSNIPANTTMLSPQLWINNGATSAAVAIAIVSQYTESDN